MLVPLNQSSTQDRYRCPAPTQPRQRRQARTPPTRPQPTQTANAATADRPQHDTSTTSASARCLSAQEDSPDPFACASAFAGRRRTGSRQAHDRCEMTLPRHDTYLSMTRHIVSPRRPAPATTRTVGAPATPSTPITPARPASTPTSPPAAPSAGGCSEIRRVGSEASQARSPARIDVGSCLSDMNEADAWSISVIGDSLCVHACVGGARLRRREPQSVECRPRRRTTRRTDSFSCSQLRACRR